MRQGKSSGKLERNETGVSFHHEQKIEATHDITPDEGSNLGSTKLPFASFAGSMVRTLRTRAMVIKSELSE